MSCWAVFESTADGWAAAGVAVSVLALFVTLRIASNVKKASADTTKQFNTLIDDVRNITRGARIDDIRERLQQSADPAELELLIREGRTYTSMPGRERDREHLERLYWSNPAAPLAKNREMLPPELGDDVVAAVVTAVVDPYEARLEAMPTPTDRYVSRDAGELFDFAQHAGVDGRPIANAFVARMTAGQFFSDLDISILLGTASPERLPSRLRMARVLLYEATSMRSPQEVMARVFSGVARAVLRAEAQGAIADDLRLELVEYLGRAFFMSRRVLQTTTKLSVMVGISPVRVMALMILAASTLVQADAAAEYSTSVSHGVRAGLQALAERPERLTQEAVEIAQEGARLFTDRFPDDELAHEINIIAGSLKAND